MSENTLLNGRYEIKEIIGRGGFATTYLAVDTKTQQQCAIKCLSFRKIEEWKTLELFEREAKVLKNLDHPQIPDYVDFFTIETEHDVELYLVQEFVEGKSLAQLVREGKHFSEQEVINIAIGIARILEYLHSLSPPIIHRDIKPSNITLNQYNRAFLIDFGSVREKIQDDLQSSRGAPTIVGTYGYMPLEQAEGRALPASDIYSLGMTLIHLLSHKDPSQMDKDGLRLDFRPHVNISLGFAGILERMIEPDWHNRYQNASELRRDLKEYLSGKLPAPVQVSKPKFLRPAILVTAIILLVILIGGGLGYVFWTSSPTPPPLESLEQPINAPLPPQTSPASVQPEIQSETLNQRLNAPLLPQPSPTAIPQATLPPAILTPKPPESQPEKIVYPANGKIGIDIYRDFTFEPTGWPMGLSVGQTTAGSLDTLPHETLIREPEYRSEQVLYGYLPLGNGDDRQITFVFDDIDRPAWVVYVDKNNNEDLTDDGPPHPNEGTGKMGARLTVQIEIVTLSGEKIIQPYRLWLWFIESQGSPRFYTQCHYAGKIFLAGEVYTAIAYELEHHDGLFRESGLWVDLNRDEKLDQETEHFSDGAMIRLGNEQYQLELQYP